MRALFFFRYCSSDREWRSSSFCVTIGMMVQCSSQTSVFLLLLMTSYRLYGTLHPFRVEESRLMGGAAAATFAAWLISIIIAVIPQVSICESCAGDDDDDDNDDDYMIFLYLNFSHHFLLIFLVI